MQKETAYPQSDSIRYGYPFGLFPRLEDYRDEWASMRAEVAHMRSFRFRSHRLASLRQRQVYVLVIGEASRRDHWQLFGYGRPTNPELSQERQPRADQRHGERLA